MTRLDDLRRLHAAVGEEIAREEAALMRRQALAAEIAIPADEEPDAEIPKQRPEPPPCGSEPGYQHHKYRHESVDIPCQEAHRTVNQIRNLRRARLRQEAS